jgi:hypothetical protein
MAKCHCSAGIQDGAFAAHCRQAWVSHGSGGASGEGGRGGRGEAVSIFHHAQFGIIEQGPGQGTEVGRWPTQQG